MKKRIQLKLMEENYQSQCLKKDFQVREANMSKRDNNISRELPTNVGKGNGNARQRNCRRTVRAEGKAVEMEVEPWRGESEFDLEPWCPAE